MINAQIERSTVSFACHMAAQHETLTLQMPKSSPRPGGLLEEDRRMQIVPGIRFMDGVSERVPVIVGTLLMRSRPIIRHHTGAIVAALVAHIVAFR